MQKGVFFSMLFLASSCSPSKVDRLLVGGVVHLPAGPAKVAVAIHGGRIQALVPAAAEPLWRRHAREVVELGGAHVFAGFTESHAHLTGLGLALETVDLGGASSYEEVVNRLAAKARELPPGSWVQGRGWDQNLWPERAFPTHQALSAAIPDHPVLARRVDGHAVLVNRRAMELAGIDRTTPDPPGGQILRDPSGEPTGVLVDGAVALVEHVLPRPSKDDIARRQMAAAAKLASLGFTAIHDAGTSAAELQVLRELAASGKLPIRVYVMLAGHDAALLAREFARGVQVDPDGLLTVRAVKLYADGALGSRGAWLSAPYADAPGHYGLEVTPLAKLAAVVEAAKQAGFQPCIHAIGDRAVHEVLNLYQRLLGPGSPLRPRIEHAQVVAPEDVPRFASLGVIASVQPTHCTSDMPWAPARLGGERILWAYRWRSLLAAGAQLCLGSDAPVEHPDPRLGLWAATTRRSPQGVPPEGYNPQERLTPEEAVAGYTSWAAWAAFEEAYRGRIAPGYLADLTIFDRDITQEGEMLAARVLRTVVGGKDVYLAGSGP